MRRINQIVQFYNSTVRKYVELRILDEGSRICFQIVDDSEFMRLKDTFGRKPQKGARIGYSSWNDAYLICFKLGINFNHLINKDEGQFSVRNVAGAEKEVCLFDNVIF
jgi:hypothetical protein